MNDGTFRGGIPLNGYIFSMYRESLLTIKTAAFVSNTLVALSLLTISFFVLVEIIVRREPA